MPQMRSQNNESTREVVAKFKKENQRPNSNKETWLIERT